MSLRRHVPISLSPGRHAAAERMLASGRYGNLSEVVRAGLRLLDERERGFRGRSATGSAIVAEVAAEAAAEVVAGEPLSA